LGVNKIALRSEKMSRETEWKEVTYKRNEDVTISVTEPSVYFI